MKQRLSSRVSPRLLNRSLVLVGLMAAHSLAPVSSQESEGSHPMRFTPFGEGEVLFFADDGLHGQELWRSDGTQQGTLLVRDLVPGPGHADGAGWARLGDELLFCTCRNHSPGVSSSCSAQRGLWKTDGTQAGTRRLSDVTVACGDETSFAVVGGFVFFAASDGKSGEELWRSDGTAEGTVRVRDIAPGSLGSRPYSLHAFAGFVYFEANDGAGPHLWRSDGAAEGTVAIAPLTGGYEDRYWGFQEFAGELYFTADDGKDGGELWKTDGTPQGTQRVSEIARGARSAKLFELTELAGALYFSAWDGKEREVWRTAGTQKSTKRFDLNPSGSSYPDHMARLADRILLYASDEVAGGELWAIDAKKRRSGRVKDIFPGPEGSHPNLITVLGDVALFAADHPESGMELWRTDGTEAGTMLVYDIDPGEGSGRPRELVRSGHRVFFNANDRSAGVELWVSDGSPEGTLRVKDINQQPAQR